MNINQITKYLTIPSYNRQLILDRKIRTLFTNLFINIGIGIIIVTVNQLAGIIFFLCVLIGFYVRFLYEMKEIHDIWKQSLWITDELVIDKLVNGFGTYVLQPQDVERILKNVDERFKTLDDDSESQ